MAKSQTASGFWKLILILLAAVVLFSLIGFFKTRKEAAADKEKFRARRARAAAPMMKRTRFAERFTESAPASAAAAGEGAGSSTEDMLRDVAQAAGSMSSGPAPLETEDNEQYLPVGPKGAKGPASPFPADRLTPEDLLPRDAANSKWAQANPAGQGDVKDQNFLNAGYHVGFNTTGSSLRNPSYDLRSTPANPRYTVSVWQQSTIEPDLSRRPLE